MGKGVGRAGCTGAARMLGKTAVGGGQWQCRGGEPSPLCTPHSAPNSPSKEGILTSFKGFPDTSLGKESACNAGDPSLIPESGRSTGEGLGYPLQYSWASPVAQLVKNLPAMWETWLQSLGWEDPLEKGKATHSSILAWRSPTMV